MVISMNFQAEKGAAETSKLDDFGHFPSAYGEGVYPFLERRIPGGRSTI